MMTPSEQMEWAKNWLAEDVFPLWSAQGIDSRNGSFVESLSRDCKATQAPRRAMVQARQIYSFVEATRMGILPRTQVQTIVRRTANFFLAHYADASGAFVHALNADGSKGDSKLDLYTQAFALFGLAHAYDLLNDEKLIEAAKRVVAYLNDHRRLATGGFSELVDGKAELRSNPHMHLFEAAITWMRLDANPLWRALATEIFELCQAKFIDHASGMLSEYFDSQAQPLLHDGRFVWEPGHHFEWAWLMMQYAEAAHSDMGSTPRELFDVAEKFGVDPESGLVWDELWSDQSPKARSSRFWPQCERIKAAVTIGHSMRAADQALESLQRFFVGVAPGLWEDRILESGAFSSGDAKASSLYHIMAALSEYITHRMEPVS